MKKWKKHFPFLTKHSKLVYFDSGATALKPKTVINAQAEYNKKIAANPHSTDYHYAVLANDVLSETRTKVQKFIKAKKSSEVVFTGGTTQSLNLVVNGLKPFLKANDEIWLTSIEHSSNLLPWIVLAKELNLKLREIPLNEDFSIDFKTLATKITKKSKVLTFANVSNTIGISNDVAKIVQAVRQENPEIIVVVDATQAVSHEAVDVVKMDVDFLAFSAHKMYGPFGVGILYGKEQWLEKIPPLTYGGGNNDYIDFETLEYELGWIPARFEAGTPNMSGIYAFGKAIDFIEKVSIAKIAEHEKALKKYLRQQFIKHDLKSRIITYNLNNNGPIFLFNIHGLNPQDVAAFLANSYNIATRSGAHCVRTSVNQLGVKISVRVSFGLYNSFKDIDRLILALQNLDQIFDHLVT